MLKIVKNVIYLIVGGSRRMKREKLKSKARKNLKGNYTPLVLSTMVFVIAYLIGNILDLLLGVHYLANLFLVVTSMILMMGYIDSIMKVSRGKKIEFENLFKHTHLGLKYTVLMLIVALLISLLTLLLAISLKSMQTIVVNIAEINIFLYIFLVIMGSLLSIAIFLFMVYLLVSFSQVYFILRDEPEAKIGDILSKSFDMLDGYRVKYIVLGLSFIGWMVLGLFTFGILYLWIVPYMMVVMANFYYELKNKYSYSAPLKEEKEKI